MDRRTFTLTLTGLGLGALGCRGSEAPSAPALTPPPGGAGTPTPPTPTPRYDTAAERAMGVAAGLVAAAQRAPEGGVRWRNVEEGGAAFYRTDLYTGQAGVLTFLAEAYRLAPNDALRTALEEGGRWLDAQRADGGLGLFSGSAGRAWAFLGLHEALGGTGGRSPWLAAALRLAPAIAATPAAPIGDLITGPPGQGLLLLRLHAITQDARWLDGARGMADAMLAQAVRVGDGIKFPSAQLRPGTTMFYVGLAHGTAGAAYFLTRLAQALGAGDGRRYLDAARQSAAWLDALARPWGAGTNWYRREPDQMDQQQVQWCHGAPGIGMFYAELFRATRERAYLATAMRAAAVVEAESPRYRSACQCHGLSGNADLFLKLYRETGDAAWLQKAERLAELAWTRRLTDGAYPAWPSGDGYNVNNPGLMTGTAGVGWLYLQLAREGKLPGAVTS